MSGSNHGGPSRTSFGSKTVKTIEASTAPAIGQRASPMTASGPPGPGTP
jgi:hypothetical protein